jgi:DNA-binding transcriptional MerR regulator
VKIGELSQVTGASLRSLRHYEEQGLIASRRRVNGYREFAPETAATVRRIKALLALGLTTAMIRELLPCDGESGPDTASCPVLRERLAAVRDGMNSQAEELARTSAALDRFLDSDFAGSSELSSSRA